MEGLLPRGRDLGILVLVLALVGGAGFAFLQTQQLKQAPAFARFVALDRTVEPGCRCPREEARIEMRIRASDTVSAHMVDAHDDAVRTLVSDVETQGRLELAWDGRGAGGAEVSPGPYRVRLDLMRADRSVTLAKTITLE